MAPLERTLICGVEYQCPAIIIISKYLVPLSSWSWILSSTRLRRPSTHIITSNNANNCTTTGQSLILMISQIRQLTVYTIDKTRLLSNHYTDQIYLGPDQAGINWGLLIFFSNTNRIAVFYNYPYTTTFSSSTSQSIFPPLSSSPL